MAASLIGHPLIKFPISTAIFATSSRVWVRTLPLAVAAAKGEDWQKNPTTGITNYLQMAGVRMDPMPKHVAVTLDGARRWCEKYNNGCLTYVPFFSKILQLGEFCIKSRIPALSCFVFATCTWRRGQEFANAIFAELESNLKDNIKEFKRKGIRVLVLGDNKWRFPNTLQNVVKQVEEETKNGKNLDMLYAVSYGGRRDIVEATKSICMKVMAGDIEPEDVDEALVEQHLSNMIYGVPNPDLMIRNGGKHRFSNFYLWQASHAELYFCDSLSADFQEEEFLDALRWFQQRERRFGK